jgi:hypothetical protein
MWDSIRIDGEFKAKLDAEGNILRPAATRDVHQAKILQALNFATLPCAAYAKGSISKAAEEAVGAAVGEVDTLPPAETDEDGLPY